MNRSIKYVLLAGVFGACLCGQLWAASLGEPEALPFAWSSSIDSASCREAGRLQTFLDYAAENADRTVQERMLVSVAYAQGKQLFAALVDVIDVFDHEVASWNAMREHPVWYRLKQGPWRWFNEQSASHEIDSCLAALKQQRGVYACHLGELNKAMHEMHDACEPNSNTSVLASLQRLVDVEHAILMPVGHEALKSSAPMTEVSVRIIENMGKSVNFKKNALMSLKKLNIPNHWCRNLSVYAAAAVGVTAIGVYLYCKRDQLPVWKQKIHEQAVRFWNDHLKNKFDTIKNIFWSDRKDEDKLKKLQLDVAKYAVANDVALEKNAIASVLLAGKAKTEADARELVAKFKVEKKLAVLLDECREQYSDKWSNVLAAKSYVKDVGGMLLGIAYDKVDPVLHILEHGLGEVIDIKQKHIKNNELTSAALAIAAPASVLYVGYRWLTSLDQWAKNVKYELVRLRMLLDHSYSSITTEAERQGMIIYALHHLKKESSRVPARDKHRFDADLVFLQNSQVSDEQKVQRIDTFLGPYKFLND